MNTSLLVLLFLFLSPVKQSNLWERPIFFENNYELSKLNIKLLGIYPHLFRLHNLGELYPASNRTICKMSSYCTFPMIEVTNFEKSFDEIRNLPTVLLMAGLDGHDSPGINSIYHFLRMMSLNHLEDPFYERVLDNLRIIVLPYANPSGYIDKSMFETQEKSWVNNGSGFKKINPSLDFNWKPKGKCFESTAAQMINQIFKDNLIIGVLNFATGSPSISYPNQGKGNKELESVYMHLATLMRDAAGINKNFSLNAFELGGLDSKLSSSRSNFEMWASSGSAMKENIDTNCLNKTSAFSKKFNMIDDISNRAMVFRVESEVPKDQTNNSDIYGNPLAVDNDHFKYSVKGVFSRNILIIRAFLEAMAPSIEINSITALEEEDDRGEVFFEITIRGCRNLDSIIISPELFTTQKFTIENSSYEKSTMEIRLTLDAEINNLKDPKWRSILELNIDIECDSNIFKSKNSDYQSHYMNARVNPNYYIQNQDFIISPINLNEIKIINFEFFRLDEKLMIHRKNNKTFEIAYSNELYIEIKGVPRFKLLFRHGLDQASLFLINENPLEKLREYMNSEKYQIETEKFDRMITGEKELDSSDLQRSNSSDIPKSVLVNDKIEIDPNQNIQEEPHLKFPTQNFDLKKKCSKNFQKNRRKKKIAKAESFEGIDRKSVV